MYVSILFPSRFRLTEYVLANNIMTLLNIQVLHNNTLIDKR